MKTSIDAAVRTASTLNFGVLSYFLSEYDAGPRLIRPYVNDAICLYRKFLAIKIVHWRQRLIPSDPVDEVWHSHLLMTKKYRQDCQRLFGQYLDHDPMYGSRSWQELQRYNRDK